MYLVPGFAGGPGGTTGLSTTTFLSFKGTDLGTLGSGLASVGNVNGYTEVDGEPIGAGTDFLISTITDESTPQAAIYLMFWGP